MGLMVVFFIVVINIVVFVIGKIYMQRKYQGQLKDLNYYKSLYQQNPDLILHFDLDGNIMRINKVIESYGYKEDELLNHPFSTFIVPDYLEQTLEQFNKAASGKEINYTTSLYTKDGTVSEVSVKYIPIYDDNQVVGVYGILKDITELVDMQLALEDTQALYQNVAEDSHVGIYIIDNGVIVYVNKKMGEMLGYREKEMIGKNVMNFIYNEDQDLVAKNMRKRLEEGNTHVQYQYRALKKDKSIIYMEVYGTSTIYKGNVAILGTVIDITARKIAEQKVEYMAYHDSLTGLYNRFYFHKHLQEALDQDSTKNLAVLFLDLDRFQLINDSMGHVIGDSLLIEISNRLRRCIGEQGILARNGGDEFLFSFTNLNHEGVSQVTELILDCFTQPFYIEQYEIHTSTSIGISFCPHHGNDVETLVKKADTAMYQAKRNGTNRYEFYHTDQMEKTYKKFEIEMDLHKALEQNEFQLLYQPKVDLVTGKVIGVEALIRWLHPEKGLISPADFIPMAEDNGLILDIGEWVLRTACVQNKSWQDFGLPPMVMSVNLSVRQLYQPNLVEIIERTLKETGLSPEYLDIEITESMLMDTQQALNVLKEFKNIGVQLSLDDFGTGYSSLNYLKDYPLDKLKIDQSFIRNSTTDDHYATITKTIIVMAHELNIQVVAEGVESKEQLIFLQRNLCNEAQGYLFSKPLPPEELTDKLDEMEKIIDLNGIPEALSKQKWLEEALQKTRQDLVDTIRQQQGMIFKYIKKGDKFIHTLCDGELMYRMNLMPEQIIGKELKEFLTEENIEDKIQYYQTAWQGEEKVTYEGTINGIEYIASLRPIRRGGQIVEVIGSCVDITERKQVENALEISQYHYRLIAENMLDLGAVWDETGKLLYASPSHERILGFSPEEYEGKLAAELIHPDDLTRIERLFLQMVRTKSPGNMEFRFKHSNGEWIWVEAEGNPVVGDNGEVEHFVFVGRSIDDKKSR